MDNMALKEWAVTVKALNEGRQIILLRKGGIREEKREFRVEHKRFFLYPTYEHQRENLLKEEYREDLRDVLEIWNRDAAKTVISHLAQVSDEALITEPEEVEALSPYFIWTTDYISERLRWRPKKPLHVLFLRVFKLARPEVITVIPAYGGCKSWLNLYEELNSEGSTPVLSDDEFGSRLSEIKKVLL